MIINSLNIADTRDREKSLIISQPEVVVSVRQQTLMGYTIVNKNCRFGEGLLRKYCNNIQECLTTGPGKASEMTQVEV